MSIRQIECFGVFQGGGAKGAAFAGAYRTIYEEGIRFHSVAGTSAGAIVAALIGAGATPTFIENTLCKLNFKELLRPPIPGGRFADKWTYRLGFLLELAGCMSNQVRYGGTLLKYGGIYSSDGIEDWIEGLLQNLLGKQSINRRGPICFRDLLLPTNIIASDLSTGTARIMNVDRTPDISVALAVRASCSIPIFFQPVIEGDNRLVDGGMVSNLPTFVFSELGAQKMRRVLAFQLKSENKQRSAWSIGSMVEKLVDTIVSGPADVQMRLQREVNCDFH